MPVAALKTKFQPRLTPASSALGTAAATNMRLSLSMIFLPMLSSTRRMGGRN